MLPPSIVVPDLDLVSYITSRQSNQTEHPLLQNFLFPTTEALLLHHSTEPSRVYKYKLLFPFYTVSPGKTKVPFFLTILIAHTVCGLLFQMNHIPLRGASAQMQGHILKLWNLSD